MMHIMTTMKCNMRCAHCCYACEEDGPEMSFLTFKATVDLSVKMKERVALAGGEPTIHPRFWDMMEYSLSRSDDVFVQTNGKKTDTALALSKMAAVGLITSGISQDKWHEPIDPLVVRAFTKDRHTSGDKRFIRDISWDSRRGPQKAGRCDWGVEKCPMIGAPYVDTEGFIHECGCDDAPVMGFVFEQSEFLAKYKEKRRREGWLCWKGLPDPDGTIKKTSKERVLI